MLYVAKVANVIRRRAMRHLEKGRVGFLARARGILIFDDTARHCAAMEIKADVI